jgi:FkbM family methyltransferase
MISFVLANSAHGALIVNRLDYNQSFNGELYGVGAQIFENGAYDTYEVEQVKNLLLVRRKYHGDGVVACDGGANIGIHTVEWAKLMRGWGSVVAVEAQERIFYALAGNIALANCYNARAVWAALDECEGILDIPQPDYTKPASFGSFELKQRLGGENIGQAINYEKPTLQVPATTIDALGFARIDLLKLDVEGMEIEALRGAAETIQRCRPILIVETIKTDREIVQTMLNSWGYRSFPMGMNTLAVHGSDQSASHVDIQKQQKVAA